MRIGWSGWSIEVSDDWSVTEDAECTTLVLSDQGALQASSARKRNGVVTEEDLFFSEGQRKGWGPPKPTRCGEFDGILYDYALDGSVWNRWFLKCGSTLLFVTYNGTPQAAQAERKAVAKVLSTARAGSNSDV